MGSSWLGFGLGFGLALAGSSSSKVRMPQPMPAVRLVEPSSLSERMAAHSASLPGRRERAAAQRRGPGDVAQLHGHSGRQAPCSVASVQPTTIRASVA